MLETPALEVAIALVGFQLFVLLFLYYRREGDDPTATASASAATDPRGEPAGPSNEANAVVECAECGAENDPSYRYCRLCVADLSNDSVPGHRGRSHSERLF